MANNQDKGGNQGDTNTGMGNNTAGTGQQGGQGAGSDMPNKQQQGGSQSGQKPEDKMNKDWDRSRDTGSKGGRPDQNTTDKQNPTDKDRMGGQQSQSDNPQWDKDR
ncbi:hypothetical protein ACIP1G_08165 [Pseudomonas sp. NPDC089392]|uniref:hypothetical protein n=1 Tax=Pseudomonas sp. NPDC089392 TaxID=3364459 RepID=UPI00381549AB